MFVGPTAVDSFGTSLSEMGRAGRSIPYQRGAWGGWGWSDRWRAEWSGRVNQMTSCIGMWEMWNPLRKKASILASMV